MTKEQQSNLFKQIFTTEGTGNEKGTGLGLITSYKLIEKNNGKLEVNSTPGNGTSFKIKIPKTPKQPKCQLLSC